MENQMMIGVWVLALVMSFVPMPHTYKIIGVILSIFLIVAVTYIAHKNNRLPRTNLIINLLIIGWDAAILYQLLSAR